MARRVKTSADLCRVCLTRAVEPRAWMCARCWGFVPAEIRHGLAEVSGWYRYAEAAGSEAAGPARCAVLSWFNVARDLAREAIKSEAPP